MDDRAVTTLLSCLDRAAQDGLPIDKIRIEYALTAVAEGRPLLDGVQRDLASFLSEVYLDPDDYFSDSERAHADQFLRGIETGTYHSSRSSFALSLPPGTHPDVDILIYEPREALEGLYLRGLEQNVGTPAERKAIEKLLWLRPLDHDDYKLANTYMEKLFLKGMRGKGAQWEQAKFLLDLLSPSTDAHGLVARLASSGLAKQIRTTSPHVVTPKNGATTPLDSLLVTLSHQIREAAEEGDADRVQKLLQATQNVVKAVQAMGKTPQPRAAVFAALKGSAAISESEWKQFDQIAADPRVNIALMPLGIIEHVLASIAMGELTWEESVDEMLDTTLGSLFVGGSILGGVSAVNGIAKIAEDKKLGEILKKISQCAPPRLKAFLVPAIVLSAFVYVALRETQNGDMPLEEKREYRWRFLEEMAEGFGVQIAATGVGFFGVSKLLKWVDKVPKGRVGGFAVLAVATGIGMVGQEFFTSWRRQKFRKELKEKAYADLLRLFDALPKYPPHLIPKLQTEVDRKLALLIALNILDFPSVKEAVQMAEKERVELAHLKMSGVPAERAIRLLHQSGEKEKLTHDQKKLAQSWIQKISKKPSTPLLPVTMLPAQKRRIIALWEKDLSDVVHFMADPIPLPYRIEKDGSIPFDQFEDWNFAHTLSLLNWYLRHREEWGG